MKNYKVNFTVLKKGIFSDTKIDGVEIVEGESIKDVYDRRSAFATAHSNRDLLCVVTNVEEVK